MKKYILSFGVMASLVMVGMMGTEKETNAASNRQHIRPVHERFERLADYLAWAKEKSPMGMPWYKEVRPGYYRFQPSRGQRRDDHLYSYDELRRKFRFSQ